MQNNPDSHCDFCGVKIVNQDYIGTMEDLESGRSLILCIDCSVIDAVLEFMRQPEPDFSKIPKNPCPGCGFYELEYGQAMEHEIDGSEMVHVFCRGCNQSFFRPLWWWFGPSISPEKQEELKEISLLEVPEIPDRY